MYSFSQIHPAPFQKIDHSKIEQYHHQSGQRERQVKVHPLTQQYRKQYKETQRRDYQPEDARREVGNFMYILGIDIHPHESHQRKEWDGSKDTAHQRTPFRYFGDGHNQDGRNQYLDDVICHCFFWLFYLWLRLFT
jgi:hypothetical protein